jgi:hypothetical protein
MNKQRGTSKYSRTKKCERNVLGAHVITFVQLGDDLWVHLSSSYLSMRF